MTDSKPSTKSVTLNLPIDVVSAIARLSRELDQPQSSVLVNALRRGLEFLELESQSSTDLAQLVDRIAALETLPAQMAELAAEIDRLKASAPSAEKPDQAAASSEDGLPTRCPRCDHALSAPLKSSGRQVCIQCGWTNKPRRAAIAREPDLAPDQLQKLLDQAAADAIANMKPKKAPPPENKKFPFGNR